MRKINYIIALFQLVFITRSDLGLSERNVIEMLRFKTAYNKYIENC
jgi:hypothetical protein